MIDILSKVSPGMMKKTHEEDIDISKTICNVDSGKKSTLAPIHKKESKPVCRYLCLFDQLVFWLGVLHRVYEQDRSKYHQLILAIEYGVQVIGMLNDEQ